MEEIWKPITGFEGCHIISNLGRIMRLARIVKRKSGRSGWKTYPVREKLLRLNSPNIHGYVKVTLSKNGEVFQMLSVHRLVAMHFVPNPYEKPEVNHKNGIKTDNRAENLEWVTRVENIQHACRTGLFDNRVRGSRMHTAILTEADIPVIRRMLAEGRQWRRHSRISKLFGVSRQAIMAIAYGKSWKHVQ
jgi:hypothetical protein